MPTSRLGAFEVYMITDFGGGGGGDGEQQQQQPSESQRLGVDAYGGVEYDDGPLGVAAGSVPMLAGVHSKLWTRYFPSSKAIIRRCQEVLAPYFDAFEADRTLREVLEAGICRSEKAGARAHWSLGRGVGGGIVGGPQGGGEILSNGGDPQSPLSPRSSHYTSLLNEASELCTALDEWKGKASRGCLEEVYARLDEIRERLGRAQAAQAARDATAAKEAAAREVAEVTKARAAAEEEKAESEEEEEETRAKAEEEEKARAKAEEEEETRAKAEEEEEARAKAEEEEEARAKAEKKEEARATATVEDAKAAARRLHEEAAEWARNKFGEKGRTSVQEPSGQGSTTTEGRAQKPSVAFALPSVTDAHDRKSADEDAKLRPRRSGATAVLRSGPSNQHTGAESPRPVLSCSGSASERLAMLRGEIAEERTEAEGLAPPRAPPAPSLLPRPPPFTTARTAAAHHRPPPLRAARSAPGGAATTSDGGRLQSPNADR